MANNYTKYPANYQFKRSERYPLDDSSVFDTMDELSSALSNENGNIYEGLLTSIIGDGPYYISKNSTNDFKASKLLTTNNISDIGTDTFLGIVFSALRALQSEVARLRNSFLYGINSYNEDNTALSAISGEIEDPDEEPLWTVEETDLSLIEDTSVYIDSTSTLEELNLKPLENVLLYNESSYCTITNEVVWNQYETLSQLDDSKLFIYITSSKLDFSIYFKQLDTDETKQFILNLDNFTDIPTVTKYNIMLCISRKVSKNNDEFGNNFIYISVYQYGSNKTLVEGYLKINEENLSIDYSKLYDSSTDCLLNNRYCFNDIRIGNMNLYKLNAYSKYQDFSNSVTPLKPDDTGYKYEAAHITIRSVSTEELIKKYKAHFQINELIYCKSTGNLWIKVDDDTVKKISGSTIVDPGTSDSGSDDGSDEKNTDTMTMSELLDNLENAGIIKTTTDENGDTIFAGFNDISTINFVNEESGKTFEITVDSEGKYRSKEIVNNITSFSSKLKNTEITDWEQEIWSPRGFIGTTNYILSKKTNIAADFGVYADRLKIAAAYAPLSTDKVFGCTHGYIELENTSTEDIPLDEMYLHYVYPIEYTGTTTWNEPTSVITNSLDTTKKTLTITSSWNYSKPNKYFTKGVKHLKLSGVIKAGSTYLIRCKKYSDISNANTFINVDSFDQEWWDNGELLDLTVNTEFKTFKRTDTAKITITGIDITNITDKLITLSTDGSTYSSLQSILKSSYAKKTYTNIKIGDDIYNTSDSLTITDEDPKLGKETSVSSEGSGYGFAITYKNGDLTQNTQLVKSVANMQESDNVFYDQKETFKETKLSNSDSTYTYWWKIYFVDSFIYWASHTLINDATNPGTKNIWSINNVDTTMYGLTSSNCILMNNFILDPAKQAFQGLMTKDSSRLRTATAIDTRALYLDREYIEYPNIESKTAITKFTPKASYENRNVSTDKTDFDNEKPNMLTCSFGINPYTTRTFNWVSGGLFDEYIWIKKNADTTWQRFQSYTDTTTGLTDTNTNISDGPVKKIFKTTIQQYVYNRITDVFPGCGLTYTSHKLILNIVSTAVSEATTYVYKVGRADINGDPDVNHCSEQYEFTLYPSTYTPKIYQVTDQQGFNWIEYQAWAYAALKINDEIITNTNNIIPVLVNTGDMTQNGTRINEWLDYYNAGKCLFNHLEQVNVVGNNDLGNVDHTILGTGDDPGKANPYFYNLFYCYEVPDVIPTYTDDNPTTDCFAPLIQLQNNALGDYWYVPSVYYIDFDVYRLVLLNSEITETTCKSLLGKSVTIGTDKYGINIYTGFDTSGKNETYYADNDTYKFIPLYTCIYNIFNNKSDEQDIICACHEMPYTVITKDNCVTTTNNGNAKYGPEFSRSLNKNSLVGSHMNQLTSNENMSLYWFSMLMEYFNVRLIIGGHKHTYALTKQVRENYIWLDGENYYGSAPYYEKYELAKEIDISSLNNDITNNDLLNTIAKAISEDKTEADIIFVNIYNYDSTNNKITCNIVYKTTSASIYVNGATRTISFKGQPKKMYITLKYNKTYFNVGGTGDGQSYNYKYISSITTNTTASNFTSAYPKVSYDGKILVENTISYSTINVLNLSKFPIVKTTNYKDLYLTSSKLTLPAKPDDNEHFYPAFYVIDNGYKTDSTADIYNGYYNFMCQATGYKLKSNKELPTPDQKFSLLIPKTSYDATSNSDKPNENQQYAMFAIIDYINNTFNIKLIRIHNITYISGLYKNLISQKCYGSLKLTYNYAHINTTDMYGAWNTTNDYTLADI